MDSFIFHQLNQLVFKWILLDILIVFFAKYFGYIIVIFLLLFLLKNFKKYWQMVILALFAATIARFFIVTIIRLLYDRPRPFVGNNVNLLLDHVNQSAFPSGHASFFVAMATIVYFYNKKAGLLFFVAGILVGLGRVFAGIHWPLDVLSGLFVGIFVAVLSLLFFRQFFSNIKKQSPQLP